MGTSSCLDMVPLHSKLSPNVVKLRSPSRVEAVLLVFFSPYYDHLCCVWFKHLLGFWGDSSKIWMRSYRAEGAIVVKEQCKDCFLTHIPDWIGVREFLLGKPGCN